MAFLWTIAGVLAAGIVITVLAYILYLVIRTIFRETRKGGHR